MKAGFKPADGLSIFRNLHVFILGHVLAEVGQVPGGKDSSNEPSFNKININDYPALKKTSSCKSSMDFDKGFTLGLECMLNGLELYLKRGKK
jgi:hypothetical protein